MQLSLVWIYELFLSTDSVILSSTSSTSLQCVNEEKHVFVSGVMFCRLRDHFKVVDKCVLGGAEAPQMFKS